jgi:hypothetical protein
MREKSVDQKDDSKEKTTEYTTTKRKNDKNGKDEERRVKTTWMMGKERQDLICGEQREGIEGRQERKEMNGCFHATSTANIHATSTAMMDFSKEKRGAEKIGKGREGFQTSSKNVQN